MRLQTTHHDRYIDSRPQIRPGRHPRRRHARCVDLSPTSPLVLVIDRPRTASYGSLARFDDVQRLFAVGESTCVAAGGDMSDFQYLQHILDAKMCVYTLSAVLEVRI